MYRLPGSKCQPISLCAGYAASRISPNLKGNTEYNSDGCKPSLSTDDTSGPSGICAFGLISKLTVRYNFGTTKREISGEGAYKRRSAKAL